MRDSSPLSRRLLPALVVLLAAAMRLWDLGDVPPGFQFDEAHNAIDAARVLAGNFEMFFTENGGREPLVTYLHAASLGVLGRPNVVFALRLVSAFVGIATIAVLYGFGKRFLGRRSYGLLAAAILAASYWHVHFSRFAIRAILAPLWTTAVLWAWWVAIGGAPGPPDRSSGRHGDGEARFTRTRAVAAIVCGVLLAIAVYSHPSGRLLPLVLVGHALYRSVAARVSARSAARGPDRGSARGTDRDTAAGTAQDTVRDTVRGTWRALAIAGVSALIVFLPLGGYFAQHPAQFTSHPSDVSLATVAEADHDGRLSRALAANVAATAGMFFVKGDPSTFHNVPDLPVFDPLSALFAVMGAGVVLGWLFGSKPARRDRAVLIVFWLVVGLLPTLLSDRPPNYSRAMAALPVIVLLPAIGLGWAVRLVDRQQAVLRHVLVVSAIVVAGLWTTFHHFVTFASLPHIYYSYDVEKVDAYNALATISEQATVFLHPLWAEHATIRFLNNDGPLLTLDGQDTLVLPADGRDVVVAFPAKEGDREGWIDRARSLYGGNAVEDTLTDAQGAPLLHTLRMASGAVGESVVATNGIAGPVTPDGSVFDGLIELEGYRVGGSNADKVAPGEPLPVLLVWRALAPVQRDLTVFVHLVDAEGGALGQQDREPGHASYRTSTWRPTDVVVDRYAPALSDDAEGSVFVRIGWYDRATGKRLTTGDGDDSIALGPVVVSGPRP